MKLGRYKCETEDVSPLFENFWLNTKEAAQLLRTSPGQIRNLVWERKLKSFKYGNRLRFRRSDVEQLLRPSFQEMRF